MRCLLVDDNAAFVETARRVLDPDGVRVTGTASNIGEALCCWPANCDQMSSSSTSCSATKTVSISRAASPRVMPGDLAVIMISSGTEDDYADLVAESPALGFLPKDELSADGIRRLLGEVALERR